MNWVTAVNSVIVVVGVPALIGFLISLGRKLQILESLQTSSEKIKSNVTVISNYLIRHHKRFNPSELQAFSLLTLTPEGKKLIKDIGFDTAFEQHKNDFFKIIDCDSPKLKYDVETAATKSIYALADKDFMNFLKIFLYSHPDRSLDDTAPTLGVYIRDEYLVDHPEIKE